MSFHERFHGNILLLDSRANQSIVIYLIRAMHFILRGEGTAYILIQNQTGKLAIKKIHI